MAPKLPTKRDAAEKEGFCGTFKEKEHILVQPVGERTAKKPHRDSEGGNPGNWVSIVKTSREFAEKRATKDANL